MANVYILRKANPGDDKLGTGVATVDLHVGDFIVVGKETKGVNACTLAATGKETDIAVVYNATVDRRGLSDDPRELVIKAGEVFNFYYPEKRQKVAVTEIGGTEAAYVVPGAPNHATDKTENYVYASAITGYSVAYKKIDEKFVSIGNERVGTIELECVLG